MPLDNCDLVCLTDNKEMESTAFEIRRHPRISSDPTRCARYFKMLPHLFFLNYNYSVWIDGSAVVKNDIRQLVEKYLNRSDMALFAHPERDCIYDEGRVVVELEKDAAELVDQQLERYRNDGYPRHNGLVETAVILRRHLSPEVVRVDEEWWNELLYGSRRDQISFNYVAWKYNFAWTTIEGHVSNGKHFEVIYQPASNVLDEPVNDLQTRLLKQEQINKLRREISILNESLSLRIGRRIPFGKRIRNLISRKWRRNSTSHSKSNSRTRSKAITIKESQKPEID